jgi:DNA-binding GntR family transcriptional regulator
MSVTWSHFQAVRSAVPVYVQLAGWIAERIAAGDLQDGEQLPAERQLADLIGHSPETVSKAKRVLIERGLVQSAQGIGTFVTSRPES